MAKGRPATYNDTFLSSATSFYVEAFNNKDMLPTIERLAIELGIHRDTAYEWEKTYPEFGEIMENIRQLQKVRLIENGITSKYNTPMSIFLLKANHGMIETNRQELTGKDGEDLLLKFTKDENASS